MCELLDVGLGRVLTQRAQALADLVLLDLSIASVVKQVEGFLELCKEEKLRLENLSNLISIAINVWR